MEVKCGEGVGEVILDAIRNAKNRIYVCSPYLSKDYVDLLRMKAKDGAEVKLITMEEWAKNLEPIHVTEEVKEKGIKDRIAELLVSFIGLFILSLILAIIAELISPLKTVVFWILTPLWIIYLIYAFFYSIYIVILAVIELVRRIIGKRKRSVITIKRVSFETKVPTKFVHAKIYVIDDLAFLGSVNLTESGIRRNVECLVKLNGSDAIVVRREFERLWNSI